MEIIIGAFQFGIEFNKTSKREEIVRLQTKMEEFFAKKNYSPMVEQLQIKLFCLPFAFTVCCIGHRGVGTKNRLIGIGRFANGTKNAERRNKHKTLGHHILGHKGAY